MADQGPLIPKHGGYRKLRSFQVARLVYDVTVRFCDLYISRRSRTHDQMVQAARSGVQNIAEGSQASGTSKKMELKLTNVARASLEELRLDYEDFLRQRGLPLWPPEHPALQRFKAKRCATLDQLRGWLDQERRLLKDWNRATPVDLNGSKRPRLDPDQHGRAGTGTDQRSGEFGSGGSGSVVVGGGPCESLPSSCLVANAALSLLNLCCYLLDRQLAAQATAFEQEGGFTERLYRHRQNRRKGN